METYTLSHIYNMYINSNAMHQSTRDPILYFPFAGMITSNNFLQQHLIWTRMMHIAVHFR